MPNSPYKSVRQVQLIYGALIVGMIAAAATMAAVRMGNTVPASAAAQGDMFLMIIGVMTVSCVALAIGVRSVFAGRARRDSSGDLPRERSSADAFLHPYSTAMIVRAALLEAPGMLGCVVFMITGEWAVLAAPGICLLFMIVLFPSRTGLEGFAADATRRADIFPPVHREHDGKASR